MPAHCILFRKAIFSICQVLKVKTISHNDLFHHIFIFLLCFVELVFNIKLRKAGYGHEYSFAMGELGDPLNPKKYLSWGKHLELNFSQLVATVTDDHDLLVVEKNNTDLNLKRVLIPRQLI